jgi:integrase
MITITQEQARELLVAAEGTWKHTMVLLALATGARLGELLALRRADVDLDAGTHFGSAVRVGWYAGEWR